MTSMDRSRLLRGVLDAPVLTVVRRADGYGYDVALPAEEGAMTPELTA